MIDTYTKSLLTFRTNIIKDECGNSWTAVGSPSLGTANGKFGRALQLDGQSYIVMTDGIALGGQDFTIDLWTYLDSNSQAGARILTTIPLLVQLRCPFDASKLRLCYNKTADLSGTSVTTLDSGIDPTAGLTHIAIVYQKSNSWLGFFIDGYLIKQVTGTPSFSRQTVKVQIGYQSGSSSDYYFTGAISEFRVSDGIARWMTNFTPPEYPFQYEKTFADTERCLQYRLFEAATADTNRRILMRAFADTRRLLKYVALEKVGADTNRRLVEKLAIDTKRKLTKTEKAAADILLRAPIILQYKVSDSEQSNPLCLRRTLSTGNSSHTSIINSFKRFSVTTFNVTLMERTLSDQFSFQSTYSGWDINHLVRGSLLDYNFSFLIESTISQNGLISVQGMYDQDALLYSYFFPEVQYNPVTGESSGVGLPFSLYSKVDFLDNKVVCTYGSAVYFISRIAECFDMHARVLIEDFIPYYDFTGAHFTYHDIINALFSWTSRVPRRQINVFIRGNWIFCIQRGMEENVFDISDLPHSRPIIERKLIRSLFINPFKSGIKKHEAEQSDLYSEWLEEEIAVPFSGTIDFGADGSSHTLQYKDGFLEKEVAGDKGDIENTSRTFYTYETIYPAGTTELQIFMKSVKGDVYLSGKRLESITINRRADPPTKTVTNSETVYQYKVTSANGIYLTTELETVSTIEYEPTKQGGWEQQDSETHIRKTFHVPLGNGWYGTSVTVDGEPQGASISQGTPGNKVTPYTVNEVQRTFTTRTQRDNNDDSAGNDNDEEDEEEQYEEERARLSAIYDTSFPVREFPLLRELLKEVYRMNRKTRETVSVDLIANIKDGVPDIRHIVDFTDRVRLDGIEYFLVSNRISFTPRRLIQKLQLIRWC